MLLEKGIVELVVGFIVVGCFFFCEQNIDDWRVGYIVSMLLVGEKEICVKLEDIVLEGMIFCVVLLLNVFGLLFCIFYYYGGCFVSGGFLIYDFQLW